MQLDIRNPVSKKSARHLLWSRHLLQDWHITFGHIPILFVLILLICLICLIVAPDDSGRKSSPTKTGNPTNQLKSWEKVYIVYRFHPNYNMYRSVMTKACTCKGSGTTTENWRGENRILCAPVPGVWRHGLQGRPIDLSVVVLFHLQVVAPAPHQRICSAWEFVNGIREWDEDLPWSHGETMARFSSSHLRGIIFPMSQYLVWSGNPSIP